MTQEKSGGCMCGAVRYRSQGPWRGIITCHCEECRRSSGHIWAATAVPVDTLVIDDAKALRWFRSSAQAQRAFCTLCGSSLFYRHDAKTYVAIAAGSLDGATGLPLIEEVFCAEKGDYYPLTAGVDHNETWSDAWKRTDRDEKCIKTAADQGNDEKGAK